MPRMFCTDEKEHLSGVPITKDQSQRLEEEDPQKNAESVRLAQKATGELMWLGTKTRPDPCQDVTIHLEKSQGSGDGRSPGQKVPSENPGRGTLDEER